MSDKIVKVKDSVIRMIGYTEAELRIPMTHFGTSYVIRVFAGQEAVGADIVIWEFLGWKMAGTNNIGVAIVDNALVIPAYQRYAIFY